MGKFLNLFILIGILWVVDAVAFDGRYSTAVWEQAHYEGQTVDRREAVFLFHERAFASASAYLLCSAGTGRV